MIDFAGGAPVTGSPDIEWNHGTPGRRGNGEPKIQVHYYDEHTVILRQSKTASPSRGARRRSAPIARSGSGSRPAARSLRRTLLSP